MANIKISELPAASAGSGTQEFEVNDSGTSKKVTGSQISAYVRGEVTLGDLGLTATATELNYVDGVTSAIQTQLDGKVDETATTGSAAIPAGTTAQRDGSPQAGYFRFNSTDGAFEGYDGTAWGSIGGGGGFSYDAVSGATQDLDVGAYNFFDGGTLTADTTLTFSSVPTEAKWHYTANIGTASTYDLENGFYDYIYYGLSGQTSQPAGIFFSSDGTKMFVQDAFAACHQYTLSTAWDLRTVSYDDVSFGSSFRDVQFKSDGTEVYFLDNSSDQIFSYTLSTAWDLSSTVTFSGSLNLGGQETNPYGFYLKPDGTKLYAVGWTNDTVYQYSLGTAWSLNTGSYDSVSFSLASQENTPTGIQFKPDGTKMYVAGYLSEGILQYSLGTPWAVNTASYDSVKLPITQQGGGNSRLGFFFKPDGKKVYNVSEDDGTLGQFTIATGYSVTLPASVQNPQSLFTSADQRIVYEFYTSDGGTNVYAINQESF